MFDNAWMKKWQDAVNGNGPMSWIGKHFNADLLFGFGDGLATTPTVPGLDENGAAVRAEFA